MCWLRSLVKPEESFVRTVAVCARKDGKLVLFDHKALLEEELGIDYQDELWRKTSSGWVRVYWHTAFTIGQNRLVLLKTTAAETTGWDIDLYVG
jgi:hypothetical protein